MAKMYLETTIAQNWQNVVKNLDAEGEDPREWIYFKKVLIKANGNVNPKHLARTKLGKLIETIESIAYKFQNLCTERLQHYPYEIQYYPLPILDKIQYFIAGLKPKTKMEVIVDPLNNAQPWEDIQKLITYVVFIDANLQQIKGVTPNDKNNEKKIFFL